MNCIATNQTSFENETQSLRWSTPVSVLLQIKLAKMQCHGLIKIYVAGCLSLEITNTIYFLDIENKC